MNVICISDAQLKDSTRYGDFTEYGSQASVIRDGRNTNSKRPSTNPTPAKRLQLCLHHSLDIPQNLVVCLYQNREKDENNVGVIMF